MTMGIVWVACLAANVATKRRELPEHLFESFVEWADGQRHDDHQARK